MALASDMEAVASLLSESALVTDGLVEDASIVLVAGPIGEVTACAALEVDRSDGLLRSVAVAEAERSSGIGTLLVRAIENEGRKLGIRRLFLLTTTAAPFFEKLGYQVMDRDAVPGVVRQSAEFSACASAGATAMWTNL